MAPRLDEANHGRVATDTQDAITRMRSRAEGDGGQLAAHGINLQVSTSVVIDDLNVLGTIVPMEADAPLVVSKQ